MEIRIENQRHFSEHPENWGGRWWWTGWKSRFANWRTRPAPSGLSLDIIGPMIWMVASLREAIRAGGKPQLSVEFVTRRLNADPVSDGHSAAVPFETAPVFPSRNATPTDVGMLCASVLLISLIFILFIGTVIFLGTHIHSILGIIVIIAWFCPVSPLMIALFVTYLLHRR
jgi:hypothetical protein